MRRAGRIALWLLAGLAALVVVLLAGLFILPNTGPGAALVAGLIGRATAGEVTVGGISGRFPDALRIAHIALHDRDGVWLQIDDLALDWSPTQLLSRTADIQSLTAARIAMPRLAATDAASAKPAQPASQGGFTLPVSVQLDRLHVDRLELGAPVAGAAAIATLDGTAHVASLSLGDRIRGAGSADLTVTRLDSPGSYHLAGDVDAAHLKAALAANEPPHGLVSQIATLPDLGALSATASIDGPWTAAATRADLAAGKLSATLQGRVDIAGQSAVLDVAARAPAMTPRPDVSWRSVDLTAHVDGPLTRPAATGALAIAGLSAGGATVSALTAKLTGDATGRASVAAEIDGLHLPGPKPDLFAAAPISLTAEARLDLPARPIRLTIAHPLLTLSGTVAVGGDPAADLALSVPALAPFATGFDGHANLTLKATRRDSTASFALGGAIGITAGTAPVPALIGPDAAIAIAGTQTGSDVTLSRLSVQAAKLTLAATGGLRGGKADVTADVTLPDLAAASPGVQGAIQAHAHVTGPTDDLTLAGTVTGDVGTAGFPRTPVHLDLAAQGLPAAPSGTVDATATLAGAPLALAAAVSRTKDGAMRLTVSRADWKSLKLTADLSLPAGAAIPQGHADLRMGDLAQLQPFTGSTIGGSVTATTSIDARDNIHLMLDTRGVGPTRTVSLKADGPEAAVAIRLAVVADAAQADATASLDVPARRLTLSALTATARGEHVALQAPAHVAFADGVTIDRLRLGLRQAVIELAGRVSPALDLTASIRNLPAQLAELAMPGLQADGTLQADAKLHGLPARPDGTIRLSATGLHLRSGPAAGLPPASITATADLAGGTARLNAAAQLGTNRLTVAGTAPMAGSGPLALRAGGNINLSVLDPILAAAGRRTRGTVTLDAAVAGTVAVPRIDGTLRLASGEIQDFGQGVRIHDIDALIRATGDTIRIDHFTGQAGAGTIGLAGSVGVAAPMPVQLTVTARNASPIASDLVTAALDADIALRGAVQGALNLGGSVKILRAAIQVPEKLPSSVAVLDVRRPGQTPPPPAAPGPAIGLDLAIDAPGQIFVRGRGLDAELQGRLHIGGTAAAPRPSGGFQLRRGTFSLAGTTLTFTTGTVTLDGGRIDPILDFVAQSTSAGATATLTITGYADAPKIALSSVPALPQDEILAHLLFGQSAAKLGPLQLAQIAAALAEISGVGGGGAFGALDSVRKGLGLDRLTVGSGSSGSSASVEGGRYVAPGVYVGAKQDTSGGGTQAVVQIDLYKGLKLQTTVGTSSGSTTSTGSTDSSGTGVGLTYQFEY